MLALAIASAPFATAVAGEAEDKATARELAKEGIAAEQKGDCATAIDRLERAEALYHAPPHLQHLARCYTTVGRLVDATETWRKLTLEPLPPNAPPAFKDAVTEANTELPKLEPRLARLTITTAAKYDALSVEVDGKAWPTAALDVPRVIDPGKHVVRARATGFKTNEQSVELAEGESETVTVTLEPGSDPVPAASVKAVSTAAPTASAPVVAPPPSHFPWMTVGLVTAGVGLLAIGGGAYAGLTAKSKFDALDHDCPVRSQCALPDLEGRKDSVRGLVTAQYVLLAAGGALTIAGVSMVLFAPSHKGGSGMTSVSFAPTLGGGHVALTGSF